MLKYKKKKRYKYKYKGKLRWGCARWFWTSKCTELWGKFKWSLNGIHGWLEAALNHASWREKYLLAIKHHHHCQHGHQHHHSHHHYQQPSRPRPHQVLLYRSETGLHKLWYPIIWDTSTWSKFGAHGEHGDVFLFSNLGAFWFSENLIRYSLHICLREVKNNLFSFKYSYLRHFSWRF